MLSLRKTAKLHDIDKAQLSRAVHAGKEECSGYAICRYARFDDNGHIKGFAFPPDYEFPSLPASANQVPTTSESMCERASSRDDYDLPTLASALEVGIKNGTASRIGQTYVVADTTKEIVTKALTTTTPQAIDTTRAMADVLLVGSSMGIGGLIGLEATRSMGDDAGTEKLACVLGGLAIGAAVGLGLKAMVSRKPSPSEKSPIQPFPFLSNFQRNQTLTESTGDGARGLPPTLNSN